MKRFDECIRGNVLLFDGSMGALLASMGHSMECPELLNVEKPDVIASVHERYAKAGAQTTITNTLGSSRLKLKRTGYADRAAEFTRAAVENARRGAGENVYVALDVGSTGDFLAPLGSLSMDDVLDNYREMTKAGAEAGADLVLLETQIDIAECRAACIAARETGLPVAASFTFNPNGRTLTGGSPECAALILAAVGATVMGVNCSGGPQEMLPILKAMRSVSPLPVIVQPNAGLPETDADGNVRYPFTPEIMLPHMQELLEAGASAIGGCCGTTPEHIALFATLTEGRTAPAPVCGDKDYICSTRQYVEIPDLADLTVITDTEDLYDLDPDELAIIDLAGLSPEEAAETAVEAQSICSAPLSFRSDDTGVLAAALLNYAGVAGVDAPESCDAAIAAYGAKRL